MKDEDYNYMHFFEYGSSKNDKIILIHGFNIPYQMWNPQVEHFFTDNVLSHTA